jgi:hypothetical protein
MRVGSDSLQMMIVWLKQWVEIAAVVVLVSVVRLKRWLFSVYIYINIWNEQNDNPMRK